MKALKYLFILLLVAIIATAVYFSLQDGSYSIESSKVIEAPPSLVYNQLADFENWDHWNSYTQQSNVNVALNEQTAGVDANLTFSDEDGDGSIAIARLDPNKALDLLLTYDHSLGKSTTQLEAQLVQVENGTRLSISAMGEKGLMEKVGSAILGTDYEGALQSTLDESMNKLNAFLQAEMQKYTINVDGRIDLSGGYYLYMSSSSSLENLSSLQSQMLQSIHSFMDANGLESFGADRVLYEKFDETAKNAIFSVAVPVQERVLMADDSRILTGFMEPQPAIKVTLKGSYKNLREAWKKGEQYIAANGMIRSDQPAFEIYKSDSYKIKNPADYITEIYLPIQ